MSDKDKPNPNERTPRHLEKLESRDEFLRRMEREGEVLRRQEKETMRKINRKLGRDTKD
jgi:hypothetical protein